MTTKRKKNLGKGKEVTGNLNTSEQTPENDPEELLSVFVGSNRISLHRPTTEEVNHKIHDRTSERDCGCFDSVRLSEVTDSR